MMKGLFLSSVVNPSEQTNESLEQLVENLSINNLERSDINAFQKLLQEIPDKLIRFGIRAALALILFLIGRQLIKLIRKFLKKSLNRAGVAASTIGFVDSSVKALLYVFLIVMLAANLGVGVTSIVALLTSMTLTIGLALQGSLTDFAGGILILLTHNIRIGDYIIENASHHEGTVEEIGIFYTRLVTIDERVVVIPNSALASTTIVNVTSKQQRLMNLLIPVSYETNLDQVKKVIMNLILQDERIDQDKLKNVFVSELGESSINIGVRFFVNTEDYWNVKWDFLECVKKKFDESNITIPYNQLDVHLVQES